MSSENIEPNMTSFLDKNTVNAETETVQIERPTDVAELHKIIDSLEQERNILAEKLDKVMRAYADAENRTKRAEKDKIDAIKYAPMKMARDMLDVADNFERALKTFPETNDDTLKEVFEGLSLTEKSLHQVLGRFDVKPIDTNNVSFDPNFHEAVTQIPVPDKKSGDIIDVVRKGYTMGERLLRPAQVVTVA
jgi:molecular chaperone GrpE